MEGGKRHGGFSIAQVFTLATKGAQCRQEYLKKGKHCSGHILNHKVTEVTELRLAIARVAQT